MGNCFGGGATPTKKQEKLIKLLLLGSGESGKSTFFKQIKILYDDGYSEEEIYHYKSSIYANIFHTIKVLSTYVIKNGKKFDNPKNLEKANKIIAIAESDTSLLLNAAEKYTDSVAADIAEIWNDKTIKEAFQYRYDYHVFDGAEYFFENLDRLKPGTYTPTCEDILRCRRKTTGITQIAFSMDNVNYEIIDVGGQRNERKKWKKVFENISIVLYVASLADYDQKCYEDDITNRMIESMDLFDEVINGNHFKDSHIMLFLNKLDVFGRKVVKNNMKDFFPKYTGGGDMEKAKKFIEDKFKKINKFDPERIHTYFTQATQAETVRKAFEKTMEVIAENNVGDPV